MASTAQTRTRPAPVLGRAARGDVLLRWLLGAVVVGVFLQITLGGVVRVTGSGDGCPDWPTCFGRWIPPLEYHALFEWSHRTVGALAGAAIVAAVARAWLRHRRDRALLRLLAAALLLIVVVGVIGGRVVLTNLDPAWRTLHLALAEADLLPLLAAFALIAVSPATHPSDTARGNEARFTFGLSAAAAAFALAALLSGAYAVWRGAGAVCPSWPLCGGAVVPQSELAWIHMAHRALALGSAVLALWAAHRAFRMPAAPAALRATALGVAATVIAQALVGAANPWTVFSQWARAAHLSLATLLWANVALLSVLVWLPWRGRSPEAGAVRDE